MIGQTISHYRILEKLGGGGMGVVYKAEDTQLGRTVAIKFLSRGLAQDPRFLERFRREARAASALDHPNICHVYEIAEHEGQPYIVMQYIDGQTLKDRISERLFKTDDLLDLAIQVADALEAAHAKGIVHRDIKPANIFITTRGQAKILDFGLAKRLPGERAGGLEEGETAGGEPGGEALTSTGMVVGTVEYMSPEQVRAEEVDQRTDLFSFGLVLYEMATRRRAFAGDSPGTIFEAILNRAPTPLLRVNPELPPALEGIISKMLEKDRMLRYQTAADLKVDLHRLKRETETVRVGRAPLGPPEKASSSRRAAPIGNRLIGAVAAAAVVMVAAVLAALNVAGLRDRVLRRDVPPPKIESVAVLPLTNLSADPAQEYFADGMTEALISEVGQIGALRVISRQSVMRYKHSDKPLTQIAQELNVDAVVEGSVLRAGNRVRITAELIGAVPERHLWARSYERDLRDVLALQGEVAQGIAREVQVKLTPQEQTRLATARTVNPEAYAAYLRGRLYASRVGPEGRQKAIEYFQRAVQLDAGYALAYASLAEVYAGQNTADLLGIQPQEAYAKAREAALRALSLDDSLAEAHAALGSVKLFYEWDWGGAERAVERAFELNPNYVDAYHWLSHLKMVQGRREESLRASLRALELDPLSTTIGAHLAWHYLMARQYDEAIQACRKTLEIQPESTETLDFLGRAYAAKGMHREAIAKFRKVADLTRGNPTYMALLAWEYAQAGRRREALTVLEDVKRLPRQHYLPGFNLAAAYAALGEKDEAFRWLETAYGDRSALIVNLRQDFRFDPLRSDPRFQDLLRRMNLPP
jgi:TolB-like protein/tetratricopeptide (TPR) repeat protein